MSALEWILIIGSIVLLIGSFIMPDTKDKDQHVEFTLGREEIQSILVHELKNKNVELEELISDAIKDVEEDAKRKLEYLTNEKIMAINEYSDQVMDSIQKNHSEVLFMYSMLNEKESDIKELLVPLQEETKLSKEQVIKTDKDITSPNVKNEKQNVRQPKKVNNKTIELGQNLERAFSYLEQRESKEKEASKDDYNVNSKPTDLADEIRDKFDEENKKERILSLYKSGKSIREIAKEGKFGVGEVKLVIDLYRGEKQ